MDLHDNGVICTKSKLWKRKKIILSIIDYMLTQDYQFQELVFGEPNNFVFADEYHEIEGILKKKGYFGIRLKFKRFNTIFEVHSNTNGINNVKYEIFTDDEEDFEEAKTQLNDISNIIGSSNESLVKSSEFLSKQRKLRTGILIVTLAVGLYFLNVYVLLWNILELALSFAPILFILLLIDRFRRR